MPLPIQPIQPVAPLAVDRVHSEPKADTGGFRKMFADAVEQVENYRATADSLTKSFLAGENQELHNVVLATQQSELAFEAFQQVRNKVVQAYQEVMRMQL